jgi:hypothetical protein
MPFTPEQREKIKAVLGGKLIHNCPLCGHKEFTLAEYLVQVQLQLDATRLTIGGGPSLPCVATVCENCGYTMLHNVMVLGLGDLLGVHDAGERNGG